MSNGCNHSQIKFRSAHQHTETTSKFGPIQALPPVLIRRGKKMSPHLLDTAVCPSQSPPSQKRLHIWKGLNCEAILQQETRQQPSEEVE